MDYLDKQKIVLKYMAVFAAAAVMLTAAFFFLRWLFMPDYTVLGASDNAIAAFNGETDKKLELYKYSQNPYISIINKTIPTAEVCYESSYQCEMSGLAAAAFSRFTDGMHANLDDPLTYFNFVFSAFSDKKAYEQVSSVQQVPPSVTNFEEAPEGEIYFSEEDEYSSGGEAGGQAGTGQPAEGTTTTAEGVDYNNMPDPAKVELANKDPQILIYHTHATESYMPNTSGNYHTLDEKYNMIPVGDRMTKVLESKYKYRVIHDETYHDKESYAYSYANSLMTVKKQTSSNRSIKVILDIHRDAFAVSGEAEKKSRKNEYTVTINGKKAARVMLVVGKANPNYPELEKFAVYIKKKMDKLYPGLFLKIDTKQRSKYNQYFSNYSMLIEVGCMLNTTEEAQYTGELMGNVIGEVLKDLKE